MRIHISNLQQDMQIIKILFWSAFLMVFFQKTSYAQVDVTPVVIIDTTRIQLSDPSVSSRARNPQSDFVEIFFYVPYGFDNLSVLRNDSIYFSSDRKAYNGDKYLVSPIKLRKTDLGPLIVVIDDLKFEIDILLSYSVIEVRRRKESDKIEVVYRNYIYLDE